MALAKARIWAGLATAPGNPAASAATTTVSKPPVAFNTTRAGLSAFSRSTRASSPADCVRPQTLSTRTHCDVETIFRNVDTNDDSFHGDPSLCKRARSAAPATVRVRWNGGRGTRLTDGLIGPGGGRTPARHRTALATRFG